MDMEERFPIDPLDIVTLMKNEHEKNSSIQLRLNACEKHIICNDISYEEELKQILEDVKNKNEDILSVLNEDNWPGCCLPPALFLQRIPHLLYR